MQFTYDPVKIVSYDPLVQILRYGSTKILTYGLIKVLTTVVVISFAILVSPRLRSTLPPAFRCTHRLFSWYIFHPIKMIQSGLISLMLINTAMHVLLVSNLKKIGFNDLDDLFRPDPKTIIPVSVTSSNKDFLCEHVDFIDPQCPTVIYKNVSRSKIALLPVFVNLHMTMLAFYYRAQSIAIAFCITGIYQEYYTALGYVYYAKFFPWLRYPSIQAAPSYRRYLAAIIPYFPIVTPEFIQKYSYLRDPARFMLRFRTVTGLYEAIYYLASIVAQNYFPESRIFLYSTIPFFLIYRAFISYFIHYRIPRAYLYAQTRTGFIVKFIMGVLLHSGYNGPFMHYVLGPHVLGPFFEKIKDYLYSDLKFHLPPSHLKMVLDQSIWKRIT